MTKLLGRNPTRAARSGSVLFVLVMAGAWLGAVAPASAYVKGGKPWPHGIIRYYNTDKAMSREVAAAAAAWNHSGAHVHFVATSRARAHVFIYGWPKHISPLAGCDQRIALGCASLGFVGTIGNAHYLTIGVNGKPRSTAGVWLRSVNITDVRPAALMTVVATHELGHILGLGHSQRCATMDASVDALCHIPDSKFLCNPLQNDDARGAVALYGGHARTFEPRSCDYIKPPIAPIGLTAKLINADPADGYLGDIQIRFKAPHDRRLEWGGETIHTVFAYAYTINLGKCVSPSSSSYGGPESSDEEVQDTVYPSPAEAGIYCIAVENEDGIGQLSAPAEVHVTVSSGSTGGAVPSLSQARSGPVRRRLDLDEHPRID